MTPREKALADIEQARKELFFAPSKLHSKKDRIEQLRKRIFAAEHPELDGTKELFFWDLLRAESQLEEGGNLPPLLMLELFLHSYGTGLAIPDFVLKWLYQGALAFHQAEGKEHFERGLGFTAGSGKRSGQGHEFKIKRRENYLNRERLYTLIAMLSKVKNWTVEDAVDIVSRIHEFETTGNFISEKGEKGLTYETLLRGYKAYKGKSSIKALINTQDFRERWEYYKEGWEKLFKQLEDKDWEIPQSKTFRRKHSPRR